MAKAKKVSKKSGVRSKTKTSKKSKSASNKPQLKKARSTPAKKASGKPSKAVAVRKSGDENLFHVTLHNVDLVTETACKKGKWMPQINIDANVLIDDLLGTVVFSGMPCNVTASENGKVTWVRGESQVNSGFAVCLIQPSSIIIPT